MSSQKPHYQHLRDKPALKHLEKDPVMKELTRKYRAPSLARKNNNNIFLDLIETIINQQLSGKAADAILERFKNIFGRKRIEPRNVLEVADKSLRASGLSFPKIKYIKGLCLAILDKTVDIENLDKLSDQEATQELTSIKGIGPWSAEMMLIFSLNRPDVFSVSDLGLCTAVSRLYKIDRKDKKAIERISQNWSPYRSYACWYLWRSLENR